MLKLIYIIGFIVVGFVVRRFLITPKVPYKAVVLPLFHLLFFGYMVAVQAAVLKGGEDADFLALMLPLVMIASFIYLMMDLNKGLNFLAKNKAVGENRNTTLKIMAAVDLVAAVVFLFLFTRFYSTVSWDQVTQANQSLLFPINLVVVVTLGGFGISFAYWAFQNFFQSNKSPTPTRQGQE